MLSKLVVVAVMAVLLLVPGGLAQAGSRAHRGTVTVAPGAAGAMTRTIPDGPPWG